MRSPSLRLLASGAAFAALLVLLWTPTVRATEVKTDPRDATVLIRVSSSLRRGRGSGFLIGDGGWVVTAYHVVAATLGPGRTVPEGSMLVLIPWTGQWVEAQLRAYDAETDLALLRLETAGFPALPLEGISEADPAALAARWQSGELDLTGFPAELGVDAKAEQSVAEFAGTKLKEMGLRGKAAVCFLEPVKGLQSGWSGGAVTRAETGAVVAVFHSVFRLKKAAGTDADVPYPCASLIHQLAPLLRAAGADPERFGAVAPPRMPKAPDAAARVARQIRSVTFAASGNWQRVEGEQQENLRRDPQDAEARFLLGIARAAEGDMDGAVRELRMADATRPASVLIPLHLALALQKKGDSRAAETEYRRALSRFPAESEAELGLGRVLAEQDRYDDALEVLRKARERAPYHPVIRYQIGLIEMKQGDNAEALKDLRAAVELTPMLDAFLHMRVAYGRALEATRQPAAAEREYRTVTRRDPGNGEAYFYLANLYARTGRIPEARLALERLKKARLDPILTTGLKEIESKLDALPAGKPHKEGSGR